MATQDYEDCWTDVADPFKTGQWFWTGRTEIAIQPLQEEDAPELEDTAAAEPEADVEMAPVPSTPAPATPDGTLRRKRSRTRQLQRGFWQDVNNTDLLQRTKEWLTERASHDWQILPLTEELGRDWESQASAEAEVVVILVADKAKKLRKPQPHASPAEVPLRKSFLARPLVAQHRELCVIVFGKPLGDIEQPVEADPRAQAKEMQRAQKWATLPRELKLAIRRVHVNLGHASVSQMLRALRVSRASEVAIRACRLSRCEACPRVAPPTISRDLARTPTDITGVGSTFCVRAHAFRLQCCLNRHMQTLHPKRSSKQLILVIVGQDVQSLVFSLTEPNAL